jgi:hypothetical protein
MVLEDFIDFRLPPFTVGFKKINNFTIEPYSQLFLGVAL